ncbi:glycoside hydrolase family 25 protein [Chryseobacterium nematophagum]|uniref:Glycoside hydrolase family 25 protein n=1 Tax=Chryseobacterium nematophagum TaxID=2305228 RepID=A0A3M7L8R4_9FLAO|nr:GH25 family lysozyme [Chryseobacterium nematophagum]RMZ57942.1 glycoside hydrolase family 25 protein [Chryseobacterium nematophagum]
MPQKKYHKQTSRKIHQARRKNYFFYRNIFLALLMLTLIGTGLYLKKNISYYYALYFNRVIHKKLQNTEVESLRIQKIISENLDKTYGFDISHYQNIEDIQWDSLSVGNKIIPLEFVVIRATMGNQNSDKHFNQFWKEAKKHDMIRGAYHFYRADEDPIIQANNFLENVKLESGDLPPILDIEKVPKRKTNQKLIEDLKVWCKIIEEAYGQKPIIYTYYNYYKDFLEEEFQDYPLWLANYNDVPSPTPNGNWDFWQFTENGIVHGINTKVDLDIYNGSIWSLKRLTLD